LSILFRENLFFFIPYLAFLVLGIFEITMLKKGDTLLWINKLHKPYLDTFFYYTTMVGDGVLYAVVIVPLVLYRVRYGFIGVIAFASTGIVTQIVKRILAMPRPKAYFPPSTVLHYVPGLSIYMTNSMPSGHSATSFSMFLLLSILTPFKPLGSLYFVCALLVALSRIYLVEHFFVDTYVGSLIGVICTILTFLLVTKYLKPASKWAEYSVYGKRMEKRLNKKSEIRNKK
jgi:membrane-associated phospholipid phosphatase